MYLLFDIKLFDKIEKILCGFESSCALYASSEDGEEKNRVIFCIMEKND